MNRTIRLLSIGIMLVALVSIVVGIVFLQQGFAKRNYLITAMEQEQITFDIDGQEIVIDNANEAQIAGDTVREHRHGIAPTYGDLLGEGRFDPTNPQQLTYAQALNLENYLYLAVATFGLITVVLGSGAFMIISGLAFGATGFALFKITGQ